MGNSLAAKPKMPKYKKDVMHTSIAVVLYIIIGHVLPYSEPMTGMGMQLVGIFVMTVYLWTTVSTFWPSVLAVFMCGTTGYCTGTVALKECFGHGMTVFVAFMFMFNVAMNESGFSRRIALFFVTRKFVKGKPWLIMFMLMFSVWFVSAFVTSSAVYAMFLSIGEEMLKMTNCDGEDDDLPEAMYCCMAWIDQANQGSTPMSHTNVLLGMSFALTLFGYDIPFMTVMFVGLAACFVMFIVIWLEFRFLQRPNVQKMADLDIDALKATVPPMQKREKWVAGAFIVLIIMWVFPQTIMKIPGLEAFGTMLNRLGTYAPPLLIVAALSIIPCEGKPVLNLKDACTKINWGAWAMMAALMGMATFLGKSDYGVMPYLTEVLGGAMAKLGLSGTAMVIISIILIGIQTNFMSNTASGTMFNAYAPIIVALGGANPIAAAMCAGMICNCGFMLPSANPVMGVCNALPQVRMSYNIKYGAIASVMCIIVTIVIAYPLFSAVCPVVTSIVG